jgi:hypothetical protein
MKSHLPLSILIPLQKLTPIHIAIRIMTLPIPLLFVLAPHAIVTAFLLNVDAPSLMLIALFLAFAEVDVAIGVVVFD